LEVEQPIIPNFLELPTYELLEKFGAGRHKPGSGSAAALLGLVACKMMQTVIIATQRKARYRANYPQLDFVNSVLTQEHEQFFREAVQNDSVQFDRVHQARLARNACVDTSEKRRLNDKAREELMPATQIPLDIANHAADVAEKGLIVYDLGAPYVRGDSGVAISAALSSCSGALFVVYLNLLEFREGRWAVMTRASADLVKERYQVLQSEQFRRVSRIQAEGIDNSQTELQLGFGLPDDEAV
jgi:formiminotetrahydrofolate cyclodeaminase